MPAEARAESGLPPAAAKVKNISIFKAESISYFYLSCVTLLAVMV